MATSAQPHICPRCRTAFDQLGQFCRHCGAEMTPNPAFAQTGQVEAIADRRLTDSNQAWLGKIVDGRYRVIEVIGRGGMGVVYRVEHLRMGKIAAMKVLHRDLASDPDVVQRFEREAAAISRLNHPHTVQVFDFGNAQGNLYLIMELVRGLDMGRVVTRDGPIPWARAAPLLAQICGALQEAHELGIVHRDLKPENVLITRTTGGRDYAKVLDFGLAKLDQRGAPDPTDKQAIVGTPYFMAPEQIRGDEVDARTDIYSFGALMFEVLTGQHVYQGTTAVGVLTKHLTGDADAPSMRAPKMAIPPEVDHLCRKALARDPAQRWQTASELAEAIEQIYAETVTESTPHRSLASRALRGGGLTVAAEDSDSDLRLRRSDLDDFERGLKRRRALVIGVATTLALGAAGLGAWGLAREAPPLRAEAEPNNELANATRIAAGTTVVGYLGKRAGPHEGDRDLYLVRWESGSRRVVSAMVTAPPNIDINVTIADSLRATTSDEAGIGEPEMLFRRAVDGPIVVTVGQTMAKDQKHPTENVSDAYTVVVTEEKGAGELEPNGIDADANALEPARELVGYLETRNDVDVLRWTGEDGTYNVVVRADKLPLVWNAGDSKQRTPGAARIELKRGQLIRLERMDKAGKGMLPARDAMWSIVVTK
jgi:serine/threonine-protein kinase